MSFEFDFTREKLAACIYKNKNPDPWYDALSDNLPTFEIVTPARVAGFIAQCQHESLDFTLLQENLNYSAKGLNGVFRKYFPTMDLVFMRNVMMYFDMETRKDILRRIRGLLAPYGYLILGGTETTLAVDDHFERVPVNGTAVYRVKKC